jgi:hypothetical protein
MKVSEIRHTEDCHRCGRQPSFVTAMLEPTSGKTFRMFRCENCGEQSWLSDSGAAIPKDE